MALLPKAEFLAQLTPDSNGVSDKKCPVCFENAINVTSTICQHHFCFNCLRRWLLGKAHTCPSCRRALFDKPENEEESSEHTVSDEEEDEEVEEDMPDFGFDYDVDTAQRMRESIEDLGVRDSKPSCALGCMIHVDYDSLLTVAVARIERRMHFLPVELYYINPEPYIDGWYCVASAIEKALNRNRGREMAGLMLFCKMEYEIQKTLRAPANAGVWESIRRGSSWGLFNVCITGVLRRVVESGSAAISEHQRSVQHPLPESFAKFSERPFHVHPQDFYHASQRIAHLVTRYRSFAEVYSSQVYISTPLLLPICLANIDAFIHCGSAGQEIRASNDTNLIEMYHYARTLLPVAAAQGLQGLHGVTMSGLKFVLALTVRCIMYISAPAEWPTHYTAMANLTEWATFRRNLTRILESMRRDLEIIFKTVVATAKEYHGYLCARECASPSSPSAPSTLQGRGNMQKWTNHLDNSSLGMERLSTAPRKSLANTFFELAVIAGFPYLEKRHWRHDLTYRNAGPSCRQELYEKPNQDDEEDEDGDGEDVATLLDRLVERTDFGLQYNEAATRQILDTSFHIGINDTILTPHCRHGCRPDTHVRPSELDDGIHYSRLPYWQSLSGSQLFLTMEQEVQRRLRAPSNATLCARRRSAAPNDTVSYFWLEVGNIGVLLQVVQASYHANPEQVSNTGQG
ncbi:hypothetical protein AC579_8573 [Pseudocercospora musae]|uniref:RING-type domain-containing protein n=1 Tax=Pseudocercospora musae TaxID=113226 RepID=A0A139IBH8_9PEZI|nr:hypothetical protein AC579_8573 [Pseudocercospora musae]